MIAVALAYVERANGKYRYKPLRPATQYPASRRCFSNCGNPRGHGRPPFKGPMTNGMGPRRRKNASALGITETSGRMRGLRRTHPTGFCVAAATTFYTQT